jgi:LuxR family transcriptional regulator, regulator of acetate metabolism
VVAACHTVSPRPAARRGRDASEADMIDTTEGPDLVRPLRRALPRLQWATGLDGTMAGPVTPGGRLVVTELHDMLTETMRGVVIAAGMGAGGKALQLGRPVLVNDYLHATTISHVYDHKVIQEQTHGLLAVPVPVGRELRAVLYGAARTTQPLGDRVLAASARVAAVVGRELAVEYEVARRLRMVEEFRRREEPRPAVDLREVHEELLSIARATSDEALRDRLLVLCDRLRPPSGHGRMAVPHLTGRERQVLAEVALGRTNAEVAERLAVMPTTVKTFLKNAMRKLGTRNRVETIRAARAAGLIR